MTLGEGIQQFYVFCAFVALGTLIALPYLFVVGLTKNKLLSLLWDVLYGLATVFALWKFNLDVNNGEFRLFVFAAFLSGIAISCATCKTTLDKLSLRLYNFATLKKSEAQDGKAVLQKIDGNNGGGNGDSAGVSAVHAVGNPHAVFKLRGASKQLGKND